MDRTSSKRSQRAPFFMLRAIFQLAHACYALLHMALASKFIQLYENGLEKSLGIMLTLLSGLAWDNLTRTISPWLLSGNDSSASFILCTKMTCISYLGHDVIVSLLFLVIAQALRRLNSQRSQKPIKGSRALYQWMPVLELFLQIVTVLSFISGAYDFFERSQPCAHFQRVEAYGIPLLRHPVTAFTSPALIIIILTLLGWVGVAYMVGKRYHQWTPFWTLLFVFIASGAFPPPAVGAAETTWNFIKTIAANGVEVIFIYGIYRTLLIIYRQ